MDPFRVISWIISRAWERSTKSHKNKRITPIPYDCGRLTTDHSQPYSFKTLESSTSNDSRLRKIAMMIPKPTAASAAATVITIKTNNCPETSRKKLENATNVRFTALSINSMHMNIEITLRLTITPTTPIVKSTAESARYHESCGTMFIADRRSLSGV